MAKATSIFSVDTFNTLGSLILYSVGRMMFVYALHEGHVTRSTSLTREWKHFSCTWWKQDMKKGLIP